MPNNFHGYTLSRPTRWIQSVSVKSRAPHVVQPPAHRRACTAAHGTVSRARPVCLWLLSPNSAPQPCISFLPLIPTGGISPFPTQLHHIPRRAYPYRSHAPERVRYPCVVTRSACCCASRCSPPRLETALLPLHSKGMASTSSAYIACARWWVCQGRERSAQKMCLALEVGVHLPRYVPMRAVWKDHNNKYFALVGDMLVNHTSTLILTHHQPCRSL